MSDKKCRKEWKHHRPFLIIKEHGADAVRWYMTTNSQPWDNLKFDVSGVVETKQNFLAQFIIYIRF